MPVLCGFDEACPSRILVVLTGNLVGIRVVSTRAPWANRSPSFERFRYEIREAEPLRQHLADVLVDFGIERLFEFDRFCVVNEPPHRGVGQGEIVERHCADIVRFVVVIDETNEPNTQHRVVVSRLETLETDSGN